MHDHPSARVKKLVAVAIATALSLGAAACDSAAPAAPQVGDGGTLRVVVDYLPAHLDPQRINAALDANFSRLLSRTLTTFKAEPGSAGSELVPDLATDLGRPSENNTLWEFKLRDGIKWQDGTPITCPHLKYGAERNFATLAQGALPYARNYLTDNESSYQGPFIGDNNGGKGLESVNCVDLKTIQFQLRQPVGDFNYTVALPIFAPVKPSADGTDREGYDQSPLASGPYLLRPGSRTDTEFTLVRNPHWDRSTDKVRTAHADEIIVIADEKVPERTNELILDQGDARNTVMLNQDVAPNFLQQVMNDPELLARTATGPSGAVRYFAINTQRIAEVQCRQALVYAFDKRKYRQAMGGSLVGDLATTMIPPTLKAYQAFDHYGTANTGGEGDPEQARKLIDENGCRETIVVAHPDHPTIGRFVKTLVDAYVRAGIQVQLKPIALDAYWGTIATAGIEADLLYAGWIPDWANASAVLPPLFKSSEFAKQEGQLGGANFSYLDDKEVDAAIEEAMAEADLEVQWRMWGDLDSKLQELAATIPVLYPNSTRLMGSNVGGAFIHSAFAAPDLCALGLFNPAAPAAS